MVTRASCCGSLSLTWWNGSCGGCCRLQVSHTAGLTAVRHALHLVDINAVHIVFRSLPCASFPFVVCRWLLDNALYGSIPSSLGKLLALQTL